MGKLATPRQLGALGLLLLSLLPLQPARADIDIIVNPHNPVKMLTRQELRKIFLGRMPLFPKTGREIHAIDLPDDDPTFIEFYRRVVKLQGIKLKRYRAYYLFSGRGRLPDQVASPRGMLQRVETDPAAIGYVNKRDVNDQVKVLLVLPGVMPEKTHKPVFHSGRQ